MGNFFSKMIDIAKQLSSSITQIKAETKKVATPSLPNVVIESRIATKFASGIKPRYSAITEVVIHGTAGGSNAQGLINWMLSGEKDAEYSQGIALFHYAIDRDGTVYEIINPDRGWVWHSSSGAHDELTIGIELINPSSANAAEYTNPQYHALARLILNVLVLKYPTIKHLISHNFNQLRFSPSYGGKECPGAGFDWGMFKEIMEVEGAKFQSYAVQEAFLK